MKQCVATTIQTKDKTNKLKKIMKHIESLATPWLQNRGVYGSV